MASRIGRAILIMLTALGLAAGLQAAPASADMQMDISVFQDRLAPYGHWFRHPHYGWAWYPTGVEAGWRPYTHGHWVWTAEYGWYWDSDYDWGWAPFHYGRWAFDPDYGWIWVPASVWAPAWVVWRSGGGYVGWAPMPPEALWHADVGFGGFNFDVGNARAWSFCEERHLADPRPIIVPQQRNVTIIKQTTNVTNYVTINNRIVNRSVDVHHVEAAAHTHIKPVHVTEVDHPSSGARKHATSDEVQVFRPTKKPPQATNKELAHQQAVKHQGPVVATPENQQNPRQVHESERQKQQEDEKRRRLRELQCQQNPAACPAQ
jgi:hypothetical protein